MSALPQEEPFVYMDFEDGLFYDPDTGDVEGHLNLDYQPGRFFIHDQASADWALERRSNLVRDRDALKDQLVKIVARQEAEIHRYDQRIAAWDRRFMTELVAWAKARLEALGGKARTLHTLWGDIAFTKTRGTHKINDMEAARDWAALNAKAAIKTKTEWWVNVTDLLPYLDDGERPSWLDVTEPGESVTIKTGAAA